MPAHSHYRTDENWGDVTSRLALVRTALYMPASNAKAVAKAPHLDADLIILDLEDAVPEEAKDIARSAAVAACNMDFGHRLVAIRCNAIGTAQHEADIDAIASSQADLIVIPKVEDAGDLTFVSSQMSLPIIAMIESGRGLYAARAIAELSGVAGLFAGTNDLASELGIPMAEGRSGLTLALQMMVLSAKSAGKPVFDGVNNQLDDTTQLQAEAQEAKRFGFTGKTAIHPRQIEPINRIFSPSSEELEEARALVAAANGGAERFRGRMVESMHVAAAKALLARFQGAIS